MKKLTILTIILTFFATVAYAGSGKAPEQGKDLQKVFRSVTRKSFKGPENLFAGKD